MYLTFIGAARTVTGSLHLIEFNRQKLLLDCGLYQGHREEAERINRTFPFKPKDIKAVLLSHAHLDHSGNLPSLVKSGFKGPVYCTPATADITSLLLLDTARIQENDIAFFNKKQQVNNLPLKEPLYVTQDAQNAIRRLTTEGYLTAFKPGKEITATFLDAGHILGSSQILLEIDNKKILFSGDIGRKDMPIIRDPFISQDIEYLILESTYGNRTHESFQGMTNELRSLIEQGKVNQSKIIVPAFAVERTQLLVTMLKNLYKEGALEGVPVYIDSPLANNVTDVFRRHPECYDEETYKIFKGGDPFNFPGLYYVSDTQESRSLNERRGPMIIISASGMCEGGRILHHLMHSISDEKNMIVITGFQAQGTLGRKILDGANRVFIFNDVYEVKAKVYLMSGLSAHGDSNDLIEYVKALMGKRLKKIFLVHGDVEEATALKEKIDHLGIAVDIPQSMTKISL